jgi:hypothetical protein
MEGHVSQFISHPSWNDKFIKMKSSVDLEKSIDLAVVLFKEELPFPSATIATNPVKIGDIVYIGGGGARGVASISGIFTGARKLVSNLFPTVFEVPASDYNPQSLIPHLSTGTHGDSGGAAYRFNEGLNSFEIVGINRALDDDKSFTVDWSSGEITKFKRNPPLYYIQYLVLEEDRDPFGLGKFLKQNLPATSFSAVQLH